MFQHMSIHFLTTVKTSTFGLVNVDHKPRKILLNAEKVRNKLNV